MAGNLLKVDPKMWPVFDHGEETNDPLGTAGKAVHIDITEELASQWAAGADVGSNFGRPIFGTKTSDLDAAQLPPLLFDLVQNRVVQSSELAITRYAIVSHVWGLTSELDGVKYGVDWKIPIRSENKLLQILEAARVVVGERYIWLDILCLDQRRRNELEIAKLKLYYTNATGCFVWLDNAYGDANWRDVLNAISKINAFFELNQHGSPYKDVPKVDFTMKNGEALAWVEVLRKLETAPWFRRVWTLQEGVIPDKIYFCTPERYMIGGSCIWTIAGLCGALAKQLLSFGEVLGAEVTNQLQQSEIYKMLTLRKLYRRHQISYWHLAQAVRTRHCKYEQDRVLGLCAMIHKTAPIISYGRSIEGLYEDLYQAYINDGDFSPCLFLGGQSLLPDKDISMGYVQPVSVNRAETHSLSLAGNGLRMSGIGVDKFEKVHCLQVLSDHLRDWGRTFPEFNNMSLHSHISLAEAFGFAPEFCPGTDWCPAAYAAMVVIAAINDSSWTHAYGRLFRDMLFDHVPLAFVRWLRFHHLMQQRHDSALVMIWFQSSKVQLAVVTEPVEGNILAVMPSSYRTEPGPGCLICKVLSNGSLKKIGIGLGSACKASELGDHLLVE